MTSSEFSVNLFLSNCWLKSPLDLKIFRWAYEFDGSYVSCLAACAKLFYSANMFVVRSMCGILAGSFWWVIMMEQKVLKLIHHVTSSFDRAAVSLLSRDLIRFGADKYTFGVTSSFIKCALTTVATHLTANIFESGPMPTPWKFLDSPKVIPSCYLGQNWA